MTGDVTIKHPGGELRLTNVHSLNKCIGRPCVIHNQTKHVMSEFPLHWRSDRGIMERICPHGTGHPDPDDMAFWVSVGQSWQGVHGCDGCCSGNGPITPRPDVPWLDYPKDI